MIPHSTRILTLTLLLAVVAACGIGVVAADPPNEPVNYYGEATGADGEPLPEGTEIFAVAENNTGDIVDSDSTTVDDDVGTYAEFGLDDQLTLNADDDDDVFYRLGAEDGPDSVDSPYDLRGDTDEGTEGTFERNIEFDNEDVAFFDVSITTDLDDTTKQNASLTVEYEIENIGELEDTQTVEASVTGAVDEIDESEELTLDGSDSVTRELSFTVDPDADTVEIDISSDDASDSASLDVLELPFFNVEITEVPDEVIAGETIDVEYNVENEGEILDTQDIEFIVDGEFQESEEMTLGENDDLDDEFSYETDNDDIDEVTIEVASENDTATADVTVSPTAESIDLTLDDSTIRADQTTSATVIAVDAEGTEGDVTDEATITSLNDTIASVTGATIEGESAGIVTIEAEYEQAGDTFTDTAELTVLPVPDATEDENEIRDRVDISQNVTPNRSETSPPVYNRTADETIYGFTGATSTEEVRIQGDIDRDVTTTLLNQTPPEVGEPGDNETETIVTSQLDVPDDATDQDGNILMNVTTDAVDDLDANTDDLSVLRYNDTAEAWEELDVELEEETDDVITLRAEVPGFSLFSVTADVEAEEEDDDEEEEEVDEEDDGISTVLLGALGILLVILALLLYVLYQRLQEDDASDASDQDEETSGNVDASDSTGTE